MRKILKEVAAVVALVLWMAAGLGLVMMAVPMGGGSMVREAS